MFSDSPVQTMPCVRLEFRNSDPGCLSHDPHALNSIDLGSAKAQLVGDCLLTLRNTN